MFAQWQFNDRYWADFEPSNRTNPDDTSNPYRIPSYNIVNLGANWDINLSRKVSLNLFLNFNNIFNEYYIERGRDGKGHDKETFTGYWGEGRNINGGIRFRIK